MSTPDSSRIPFSEFVGQIHHVLPDLETQAKDRAEALLDSHRRVRKARTESGRVSVSPVNQPDLLAPWNCFFPLQLSDIPIARILFQAFVPKGALLPADYLVKIVEGKADGVTPEAYHLPPGSRFRSEAYQVYERLLKYWARFQEARKEFPDDQDGEGITNKEWTTHLLDELRWGLPTQARASFSTARI